jgi:hypothetical protein
MDDDGWIADAVSRSSERSSHFTNGERRATLLTWRFSGAPERKHPRSQTILPSLLVLSSEMGLIGLPLRASHWKAKA